MALAGAHIACGYAGSSSRPYQSFAILGEIAWAQTMASAGTTAKSAPATRDGEGDPIFRVAPSLDIYVAIDPAPDASTISSKRALVLAGEQRDFYANPGDKLAWVAA